MRLRTLTAAVLLALGVAVSALPAEAAVCKDPITAKGTSRIQASDAAREQRARDNAIKNWSARARSTYGFFYKFWLRADDKKEECGGSAKQKHCTVTAKPCRLR